jgi:Ni/Fe-hydrogenase 1 B-type cytochrome subunit
MAEIRRILIWSGWLRASHWAIALSTLVLLATGWLIGHSPMQADIALEYHYLAVSLLVFGLALRIVIFFRGKEHERLPALFPQAGELRQIKQVLLFYLSLGKRPLPHWYAHNPLWKVIYVLWYLALLLLIISGVLMTDKPVMLGFYLPSVHEFWAGMVLWATGLHILSQFAHDYYAKTSDVSAMINGYRVFEVENHGTQAPAGPPVVLQSMDSLIKKGKQ